MKSITSQLPTLLGSFAAMLVAFVSLLSGTSPMTCTVKAGAAFLVFAGFGLILRFALTDMAEEDPAADREASVNAGGLPRASLDVIVPGTSVADLLANQPEVAPADQAGNEPAPRAA